MKKYYNEEGILTNTEFDNNGAKIRKTVSVLNTGELISESLYNYDDNTTKHFYARSNKYEIVEYSDKSRDMIKAITYIDSDGNTVRHESEFDEEGRILKNMLDPLRHVTFAYDEDGRLLKATDTKLNSNGEVISIIDTEYKYETKENGNTVRTIIDGVNTDKCTVLEEEYDANNNLVRRLINKRNIVFVRNEKGLILEEYVNGALDTRYEYDENDNMIFSESKRGGGTIKHIKKYDENNNCILTLFQGADDKYPVVSEMLIIHGNEEYSTNFDTTTTVTTKDDNGNKIKQISYGITGEIIHVWEYHENGNLAFHSITEIEE